MENRRLVMIPGPTPVVRSIQEQMGREVAAFGDPGFVQDFKNLLADLKSLWQCAGEVFVVAGTGTMAMEMAVANATKAGDNMLIVSHGFFGDRFIDLCSRKGLNVDVLECAWGDIVPVAAIEAKLAEKPYAAITVTHVDTATGVCAPVEEIGAMIRAKFPDTLYIVDGVCATAGERELVDPWNIDILFTGSQKAFGVAPGLMMLWAGERAMARRVSLGTIPEFYVDFDKWLPIMQDPGKYYATPAINMVWALKESVRIIKEEGLDARFARHRKISAAMRAAMAELGIIPLAKEGLRAVTLSNLLYPEGVDDAAFRAALLAEGVVVAGGLGAYAGKMFRLGHMGNVDTHELVATVAAVERALHKTGVKVEFGKALGAFQRAMI